MKRLAASISAVLMMGFAYPSQAQENLWYSSSNFNEPQIIFSNPAGLSFKANRQVVFSSQLLYTGLANDNLYNHYLGYIEPVKNIGTLGLRGSYFNSQMLNQGTISLLYSRLLVKSRLSFGININLHQYSYDKDNFNLNEIDDPLLANSTSKFAVGVGLGLLYNPFSDLLLGLSVDNFNQPDISLQGNGAKKAMMANLGISYRILGLVPELDLRYFNYSERNETYFLFGLRQLLLDNAANLFVQYRQNCFSIGAAYTFKNFRLDYQYSDPLNELQEISNGSHQFTLSYNFGKPTGYASSPTISLLSPESVALDSNSFRFRANIKDGMGLEKIIVQLNHENFAIYNYKQKEKEVFIDLPVFPLEEGENKIKIIAENEVNQSAKEIAVFNQASEEVRVIASTPKIEILTPLENETKASSLRLEISVEFVQDLKDIKIKVNDKEIKLRGVQPLSKNKDKIDLEAEFDLEEGINDIEVIAFNQRGSGSQKRTIRYNPITEDFYDQLWAVVIGIDNYKDREVEDLSYAVRDARAVEKLLKERYKFDHVISLYNSEATRDNIIKAISADLNEAKEKDGVFIFFAGHGCTGEGITGGPLGFIVPVDGSFDEKEFYLKNIPMSQIKEISLNIDAKQIYYVMDCCYGGLLLRGGMDRVKPALKADYSYLIALAKKRVRQVLTAGGKGEVVIDGGRGGHSVFTGRLIQGLEGEADFNRDGFITAEELNFFVRQHVYTDVKDVVRGHPVYKDVEQTPQYGKWFGEGEFIFRASSR